MSVWLELNEEERARIPQLPPLTDEIVAACEKKFNVRLPASFLQLLRTKNGGLLQNSDFKFGDRIARVAKICGLSDVDEWNSVRPCSLFLDSEDAEEQSRSFRSKAGDPARVLLFGDADCYSAAFDYNRPNAAGEPTILYLLLDEDDVEAWPIADSFEEFMRGQYTGDARPLVRMTDAQEFRVIAQGSYEGKLQSTGAAVRVSWKICSHRTRLIVFQRQDWGWGEELTRHEVSKRGLVLESQSLDDLAPDLDASLANMIRGAVEQKSEVQSYAAPVTPQCYQLHLHVVPNKKTAKVHQSSKPFQGRWKNDSSQGYGTSVYSDSKAALEQALRAVEENSTGWKLFFS